MSCARSDSFLPCLLAGRDIMSRVGAGSTGRPGGGIRDTGAAAPQIHARIMNPGRVDCPSHTAATKPTARFAY